MIEQCKLFVFGDSIIAFSGIIFSLYFCFCYIPLQNKETKDEVPQESRRKPTIFAILYLIAIIIIIMSFIVWSLIKIQVLSMALYYFTIILYTLMAIYILKCVIPILSYKSQNNDLESKQELNISILGSLILVINLHIIKSYTQPIQSTTITRDIITILVLTYWYSTSFFFIGFYLTRFLGNKQFSDALHQQGLNLSNKLIKPFVENKSMIEKGYLLGYRLLFVEIKKFKKPKKIITFIFLPVLLIIDSSLLSVDMFVGIIRAFVNGFLIMIINSILTIGNVIGKLSQMGNTYYLKLLFRISIILSILIIYINNIYIGFISDNGTKVFDFISSVLIVPFVLTTYFEIRSSRGLFFSKKDSGEIVAGESDQKNESDSLFP